jgi:hypothetical protein
MARKQTQREVRILVFGGVAALGIVALHFGLKGLDRWREVRVSLKAARRQLETVTVDPVKQAALLSIVPVAEMPELEEKQQFLVRDRVYEQLKKAGVKTEPLAILGTKKKLALPYDVMRVKCSGKCELPQLLDFLAASPENPHLVGIEELRIRCDTKEPPEKRKQIEIDLVVSAFVRRPSIKPTALGGK